MMDNNSRFLGLFTATLLLAACASNSPPPGKGTASIKIERERLAHAPRHPGLIAPREPLPPGEHSVDEVLESFAPYAVSQLRPYFQEAGVAYPPSELALVGLKRERKLEVWAKDWNHPGFRFIRAYDIQAASGVTGPKLRKGDRQVPEGVYRITRLNPNSNYHLSMKLNYPNEYDLFHANEEGREEPGSDIFIHGKAVSAGCLAMGDAAIEELFVLAAHVGTDNIKVVIAPHDPRVAPLDPDQPGLPGWTDELYEEITGEILALSHSGPAKATKHNPVKVSSNRPDPAANHKVR